MKVPLQIVPCPLCSKSSFRRLYRENGFSVVRCGSCGFLYVNPRPNAEHLRRFYQEYYPIDAATEEAWARQMRSIFHSTAREILSSAPQGRLLDVGCGMGHFLLEFRNTGWEAMGLDLNEAVVQRARLDRGLDVRGGTLPARELEDRSFDAVTLFYLLEHLPDPLSFLREVHRILKPGGRLILRVPDMEPLIHLHHFIGVPSTFFHPPMHLSDFRPRRLKKLLRAQGFMDIRVSTGGFTSPPDPFARFIARVAGTISTFAERLTHGRVLLPGVSKTFFARKLPLFE